MHPFLHILQVANLLSGQPRSILGKTGEVVDGRQFLPLGISGEVALHLPVEMIVVLRDPIVDGGSGWQGASRTPLYRPPVILDRPGVILEMRIGASSGRRCLSGRRRGRGRNAPELGERLQEKCVSGETLPRLLEKGDAVYRSLIGRAGRLVRPVRNDGSRGGGCWLEGGDTKGVEGVHSLLSFVRVPLQPVSLSPKRSQKDDPEIC